MAKQIAITAFGALSGIGGLSFTVSYFINENRKDVKRLRDEVNSYKHLTEQQNIMIQAHESTLKGYESQLQQINEANKPISLVFCHELF